MGTTVNVVGGPGGSSARVAGMTAWAEQVMEQRRPSVVFAQEVPSDAWLGAWMRQGYTCTLGVEPSWRIRSALLTADGIDVTPLTASDLPNLSYHGSYVAAARWNNAPGGPTVLASVHASPQLADPSRYGWLGEPPRARNGGGDARFTPDRLWDSDLLLASPRGLAKNDAALVAAGDFNVALASDFDDGRHLGTWARSTSPVPMSTACRTG